MDQNLNLGKDDDQRKIIITPKFATESIHGAKEVKKALDNIIDVSQHYFRNNDFDKKSAIKDVISRIDESDLAKRSELKHYLAKIKYLITDAKGIDDLEHSSVEDINEMVDKQLKIIRSEKLYDNEFFIEASKKIANSIYASRPMSEIVKKETDEQVKTHEELYSDDLMYKEHYRNPADPVFRPEVKNEPIKKPIDPSRLKEKPDKSLTESEKDSIREYIVEQLSTASHLKPYVEKKHELLMSRINRAIDNYRYAGELSYKMITESKEIEKEVSRKLPTFDELDSYEKDKAAFKEFEETQSKLKEESKEEEKIIKYEAPEAKEPEPKPQPKKPWWQFWKK